LKENLKCEYVLNQTSPTFFDDLRELAKKLKATCLIEAIGGEMTAKLLECLPNKSTCLYYGALAEKPLTGIDPLLFIGR